MKIHQLSVFLENRPGQVSIPCKALADAGINILTLALADTRQFGILRLIVRDHEKAEKVLREAGCVVRVTEVLAVEVPDRPGGMAEILAVLDQKSVNIEYMYAFSYRTGDKAIVVFRLDKPDTAITLLQDNGINVVRTIDLFAMAEKQ
jgi:hypothetical protein